MGDDDYAGGASDTQIERMRFVVFESWGLMFQEKFDL